MEIAVVGTQAPFLCQITNLNAQPFFTLGQAAKRSWDILALTRAVPYCLFPCRLDTRHLLLPGDSDPTLARNAHLTQLIGYGYSPRDTLTLSSFTGAERLLCIQRSLLTAGGRLLEPQELPLPAILSKLDGELALLAAGLCLLSLGQPDPRA